MDRPGRWRRSRKEPGDSGEAGGTLSMPEAPSSEAAPSGDSDARFEVPVIVAGAMGGPLSDTSTTSALLKEETSQEVTPETPVECPDCKSPAEPGAKYCVACSAPLTQDEPERKPGDMEPWALKAGQAVSGLSRGVKIGIPVTILVILLILGALFILAATHSEQAAIGRYMGNLKVSDYKAAYELTSHPGGEFGSFEYFHKWQTTTTKALGGLQDFTIQKRKYENKLFGRLIQEKPESNSYVVTMKYRKRTFDVNMVVQDAGGSWPMKRWKIKLSGDDTRMLISPVGAEIVVDGLRIGRAEVNEELQDALQLNNLPDDIEGAVDYAKKLIKTFQFLFDELKILANKLETVTESAQDVVNRFGASGFTWTDLLDEANTTVQQSKGFGQDIATLAMHIYWIFGGGDDGSVRADLTRVQTGMDTSNLPEGYHEVTAMLPGLEPETADFVAPDQVEITLDPTRATRQALKRTMESYYSAISNAAFKVDASVLPPVVAGDLLVEETDKVQELATSGQHVASQLTDLKFGEYQMLKRDIATVETHETWNFTTFKGTTVVSSVSGQKYHLIYTLEEQGRGIWKVIERKQF